MSSDEGKLGKKKCQWDGPDKESRWFRNNVFADYLHDYPEFKELLNRDIGEVSQAKGEAESYLALQLGVDPEKDERYYQTPKGLSDRYKLKPTKVLNVRPFPKMRKAKTLLSLGTSSAYIPASQGSKGLGGGGSDRLRQSRRLSKEQIFTNGLARGGRKLRRNSIDNLESSGSMNSKQIQGSGSLSKILLEGEILLEKVFVLRADFLGLDDPATKETQEQLMKCYLIQHKHQRATQLTENPEKHKMLIKQQRPLDFELEPLESNKKRTIRKRRESAEINRKQKNIADMDEERAAKLRAQQLASQAKPLFKVPEFGRALGQGWGTASSSANARRDSSFGTKDYPKWTDFRARVQLELTSGETTVLREPIRVFYRYEHIDHPERPHGPEDEIVITRDLDNPETSALEDREIDSNSIITRMLLPAESNEGVIEFAPEVIKEAGAYSLHYVVHGSCFEICKGKPFQVKHVNVSLDWLEDVAHVGRKFSVRYKFNFRSNRTPVTKDVCRLIHLKGSLGDNGERKDHCVKEFRLGPETSGEIIFNAPPNMLELAPGFYVLRAFSQYTSKEAMIGESRALKVRSKVNIPDFGRFAIDREIRICIVSPVQDLVKERMKVTRSILEAIGPFCETHQVSLRVLNLMDHINSSSLGSDAADKINFLKMETLLYEIDQARPFIVFIFGERAGLGVDQYMNSRVLTQLPWLTRFRRERVTTAFEIFVNFAWTDTVDQKDPQCCTNSILFLRRHPVYRTDNKKLNKDTRKLNSDDNFHVLTRISETIERTNAFLRDRFTSGNDAATIAAIHLKEELEAWFGHDQVPNRDEFVNLNLDCIAEGHRKCGTHTKWKEGDVFLRLLNTLFEFATSGELETLPHTRRLLIPYQFQRLGVEWVEYADEMHDEEDDHDPGSNDEDAVSTSSEFSEKELAKPRVKTALETKLEHNLFLDDVDLEWDNDLMVPVRWTRSTPVAIIGSSGSGKTFLIVHLLDKIVHEHLEYVRSTRFFTNSTPFCHGIFIKEQKTLVLGFLLGEQSELQTPLHVLERIVVEVQNTFQYELKNLNSIAFGVNDERKDLSAVFPLLLAALKSVSARLIIVIDNMDELEVDEEDTEPERPHVNVVNSPTSKPSHGVKKASPAAKNRARAASPSVSSENKDPTRRALWWLPDTIDPAVLRLIITATPDSEAYMEAKRRLWNFVYLGSKVLDGPDDLDTNMNRSSETSGEVERIHFQPNNFVPSVTDAFESEFGHHVPHRIHRMNETEPGWWWCKRELGLHGFRVGSQLEEVEDASVGRYWLILRCINFELLNDRSELKEIQAASTRNLLKLALERFVQTSYMAQVALQALLDTSHDYRESELIHIVKKSKKIREFDELHWSLTRRILIDLCCSKFSGCLVLRGRWTRKVVKEVVSSGKLVVLKGKPTIAPREERTFEFPGEDSKPKNHVPQVTAPHRRQKSAIEVNRGEKHGGLLLDMHGVKLPRPSTVKSMHLEQLQTSAQSKRNERLNT